MNVAHNIAIFKNSLRVELIRKKGDARVEQLVRREMLKAGMDLDSPVEIEIDLKRDQFIVRQPSNPKDRLEMPKAGEPGSGITKTPRKKQ